MPAAAAMNTALFILVAGAAEQWLLVDFLGVRVTWNEGAILSFHL